MRLRLASLIVVWALGATAVTMPAGAMATAPPTPPALEEVVQIALGQARLSGDAHPTEIAVAEGPLWAAVKVISPHEVLSPLALEAMGGADSPVHVVLMRGRFFESESGPTPPGRGQAVQAPPARVLEVLINATELRSLAMGSSVPVPLSRLGPVTMIRRAARPRHRR